MATKEYISKNDGIASWSGRTLTANQSGQTIVEVKENDKIVAQIPVTVTAKADEKAVTGISLNKTSLNLYSDSPYSRIKATVSPSTATNKSVIWTSSNNRVAYVNKNGDVTLTRYNSQGGYGDPDTGQKDVTITAYTHDKSYSASCVVHTFIRGTRVSSVSPTTLYTGWQSDSKVTAQVRTTNYPIGNSATNSGVEGWNSTGNGDEMQLTLSGTNYGSRYDMSDREQQTVRGKYSCDPGIDISIIRDGYPYVHYIDHSWTGQRESPYRGYNETYFRANGDSYIKFYDGDTLYGSCSNGLVYFVCAIRNGKNMTQNAVISDSWISIEYTSLIHALGVTSPKYTTEKWGTYDETGVMIIDGHEVSWDGWEGIYCTAVRVAANMSSSPRTGTITLPTEPGVDPIIIYVYQDGIE